MERAAQLHTTAGCTGTFGFQDPSGCLRHRSPTTNITHKQFCAAKAAEAVALIKIVEDVRGDGRLEATQQAVEDAFLVASWSTSHEMAEIQ